MVIGQHHDPIPPFADAEMMAAELPNARLIEARSILEMRLHPERLTEEMGRPISEARPTRGRATEVRATR